METTISENISPIETALAKENITNKVIERLRTEYLGLKINGIEDKAGFNKVDAARKECKQIRNLASRICKTGREEAIRIQREWIEKEKEVTGAIGEVENYLEAQSDAIKEEERRILFEAAQKTKLPVRKEKLLSIGITVDDEHLLTINDDQFNQLFNEFHEKMLAEKAELMRIEQERINAEKAEILRKEQERLMEEQRKKELVEAAEKARKEAESKAKAEIENARIQKELAEQRAIEAEEIAKKEKEVALKRAEEEKQRAIEELKAKQEADRIAELERIEAEKLAAIEAELGKGDKEKFASVVASLEEIKTKYSFKSKKHQTLSSQVNTLIDKIITHINEKA